jgi:hypothetical protein
LNLILPLAEEAVLGGYRPPPPWSGENGNINEAYASRLCFDHTDLELPRSLMIAVHNTNNCEELVTWLLHENSK